MKLAVVSFSLRLIFKMLPARPSFAVVAVLSVLTISAVAGTWITWTWNGGFHGFQDAIAASRLPDGLQVALEYSGISVLDDYLRSCRASLETGTLGPAIDLSVNCGPERSCVCDLGRSRSKGLAAWAQQDANLVIVLYLAAVTLRGSHQVKRARLGPSTVQKVLFGSGLVLSLIRGAALCYVIFNDHITLWEFHVPSFDELRGATGYSETCLTFMKLDFVLSAAAILVIAYRVLAAHFPYHGWVLVVGVCLGGGVFGAGGTLLLVWGWRESWITSFGDGVRL
ncbi:hypothetical protein HII31_10537 [Pseudocercospora fuligena]|uniref:Uncharacterized protein n=1 Tax=Pseudocercospora fuligena TaxID=685502 RepID=A0A8H6RA41_9PEZI|nr:hypothetical protein HII31_10537 [Pseudocercospora fuligena]